VSVVEAFMAATTDFLIGDFIVHPLRSCIERDGVLTRVKPKSMAVLAELAAARGEVVTREALFDAVWRGSVVTDDVLTQSIGELRKAFGDTARDARVIETIPRIGFRLVPEVSLAAARQSQPAAAHHLPRGTWLVSTVVVSFVAAVAFFGFVARPGDTRVATPAGEEQSVAVLPFVDMSPEQDQEYFADGLSEELINRLTQLDGLRVTGRTSSFYFKGRNEDLRTIGQTLSVGHVLEGSVRKAGDQLRITAQLVDVSDGFHLWSAIYDRPQADLFAIQADIADAVANALSIRLSVGELGSVPGGTQNVEAFDELMLGNAAHKEFDANGIVRAIDHFRRATELDPEFAIAWLELANVYKNAWLVFGSDDQPEWQRLAGDAIAEAERLAPDSVYVLMTLAAIQADRDDWPAAMDTLDRVAAIESREFVQGSGLYTDFMTKTGRIEEALRFKERARWIDPLHAGTSMYLAHLLAIDGRTDDAFAELERGWELGPYRPQLAAEGVAVALSARDEAALEKWLRRAVDYEQPGARGAHTAMLERLGDADSALEWLATAFSESGSTDYYVALWASYLGDDELALSALERSRDLWAFWLPVVAPVRSDPRFAALVASAGLDEFWREYGWGEFCEPVGDAIRCR
jgi:TolB-like protein/DNA-binding winged helix-turn-helix (wHTH) protein